MKNNGCVLLNTKSFDQAISKKASLISRYNALNNEYDEIVNRLLSNWKGKGANAFQADARTVKANITGISDILGTMCDVLSDCRQVFGECDTTIGEYNRNPSEKK